jgi:hypothetical protein
MTKKDIKDIFKNDRLADAYFNNWHNLHGYELQELAVDKATFMHHFYKTYISFTWQYTPEGDTFWRDVYYKMLYDNLPDDVIIAKRAILKSRKLGYRLNKRFLESFETNLPLNVALVGKLLADAGNYTNNKELFSNITFHLTNISLRYYKL